MVEKEIHIDYYIAIKITNDYNNLHPDMEQYYENEKSGSCRTLDVIISLLGFKKLNKGKPNNTENHHEMCV